MSLFETNSKFSAKNPPAVTVSAGAPGFSDIPAREDHVHGLNLTDAGLDISASESALIFYHQDTDAVRSRIRWTKALGTTGYEAIYMEGPIWSSRTESPRVYLQTYPTGQAAYLSSGITGSNRPYAFMQVLSNTSGSITEGYITTQDN